MQNRKAYLKYKERKEKKRDFLLRVKSAKSAQLEEQEPTSEPCVVTPTQPRFKKNDLLYIAPDTAKGRFKSQTTLRWGMVIDDPVWEEARWMYTIKVKSEGRERNNKFEEDILCFKVKEQDPDHMVGSFYTCIHYSTSNVYLRFRLLEVNRWRDWKKKLMRGRENVRHSERKVRSRLTTIKS